MERKGEDVRNWIDCIFIAMLCDGGGKGQVYQYPLVPWGHTPYQVIKTLYNAKIHHLWLKIFSHQDQPNTSHRRLGKISWVP